MFEIGSNGQVVAIVAQDAEGLLIEVASLPEAGVSFRAVGVDGYVYKGRFELPRFREDGVAVIGRVLVWSRAYVRVQLPHPYHCDRLALREVGGGYREVSDSEDGVVHEFRYIPRPGNYLLELVECPELSISHAEVCIGPCEEGRWVDHLLSVQKRADTAVIRGRVSSLSDGSALAGVYLNACVLDEVVSTARTDQDGAFALGVPPNSVGVHIKVMGQRGRKWRSRDLASYDFGPFIGGDRSVSIGLRFAAANLESSVVRGSRVSGVLAVLGTQASLSVNLTPDMPGRLRVPSGKYEAVFVPDDQDAWPHMQSVFVPERGIAEIYVDEPVASRCSVKFDEHRGIVFGLYLVLVAGAGDYWVVERDVAAEGMCNRADGSVCIELQGALRSGARVDVPVMWRDRVIVARRDGGRLHPVRADFSF